MSKIIENCVDMKPEEIDAIVIHCSATKEGMDFKVDDIDRMHKERGFSQVGYHYVIDLDGTVEKGRPDTMVGAHTNTKGFSNKSYNYHSIGVCYIGGVDKNGKPKDTRTKEQKKAMSELVYSLMDKYPNIKEVIGHRDTSPDLNGDGKITKNEFIKQCPVFDVRAEFPISVCVASKNKIQQMSK